MNENLKLSKEKLNYYKSLGIDPNRPRFKIHYKRGYLENIDEKFIKTAKEYYKKNLNVDIDPITHIAYSNVTGVQDEKVIPESSFRKDILWFFNDRPMTDAYVDKSSYDLLFNTPNQVYTVIKRVRGHYFDHENEEIQSHEVLPLLLSDSEEYIIKPSDTNNGVGIRKFTIKSNKLCLKEKEFSLAELEELYGFNFLIQRVIKQHDIMASPHPSSVNSLRMVTLRWNGVISNLYTFARFGVANDIKDNAGAGGLSVGVKDNGKFMDYGIVNLRKVNNHPTTNKVIEQFGIIPNYEEIKRFTRNLHKRILQHDYISWDIAVGVDGDPIFIEANFFGTCFLNQIALGRSTFQENTAEILSYIAKNKKFQRQRNVKMRISEQRRKKINKLRKSILDE